MEVCKIKNTYYQTVLSSLYPVFFGITLSNYAKYESGKIAFPSLEPSVYITVIFLIVYYLSDWLKSVHRAGREPDKYNAIFLLFLIIFNLFYCFIILYVINAYELCILFIGVYSMVVPWWDLVVWKPGNKIINDKYTPGIRLACGVFYFIIGAILYFADDAKFVTKNYDFLLYVLNGLLFFIVAFKIFGTYLEIKKQDQAGQS